MEIAKKCLNSIKLESKMNLLEKSKFDVKSLKEN